MICANEIPLPLYIHTRNHSPQQLLQPPQMQLCVRDIFNRRLCIETEITVVTASSTHTGFFYDIHQQRMQILYVDENQCLRHVEVEIFSDNYSAVDICDFGQALNVYPKNSDLLNSNLKIIPTVQHR